MDVSIQSVSHSVIEYVVVVVVVIIHWSEKGGTRYQIEEGSQSGWKSHIQYDLTDLKIRHFLWVVHVNSGWSLMMAHGQTTSSSLSGGWIFRKDIWSNFLELRGLGQNRLAWYLVEFFSVFAKIDLFFEFQNHRIGWRKTTNDIHGQNVNQGGLISLFEPGINWISFFRSSFRQPTSFEIKSECSHLEYSW